MTATDPRPQLAAMPAARLAPAAEALAEACAEDMGAAPPPADRRADADRRRAGRAALAHPRQLLALLDWSAERMPGPERAGQNMTIHDILAGVLAAHAPNRRPGPLHAAPSPVMPLHVMPGLVPGIPLHRFRRTAAWMPGTSPGMTERGVRA